MSNTSSSSSSSGGGGGGCPVKHQQGSINNTNSSSWSSWLWPKKTINPNNAPTVSTTSIDTLNNTNVGMSTSNGGSGGGCPVKHSPSSPSSSSIPQSREEAAKYVQTPHPDQKIPLSTVRSISSIPRGSLVSSEKVPHHQPSSSSSSFSNKKLESPQACNSDIPTDTQGNNNINNNNNSNNHNNKEEERWVYPSEQQFYNAMKRKGWKIPPGMEQTIPQVVRIHNAVNERGWSDVVAWEELRGNTNPQLVRFLGRPNDLSPRAWINSRLFFYKEPFDRHDWYVGFGDDDVNGENGEGGMNGGDRKERRYVIDFYSGDESSSTTNNSNDESSLLSKWMNLGSNNKNSTTKRNAGVPSMYLDVRPAIDDSDAVMDRTKMFFKDAFPGIYRAFRNVGVSGGGATNTGSTSTSTTGSSPIGMSSAGSTSATMTGSTAGNDAKGSS